ncbi:MAG: hypothetical protein COU10_01280 [Candidatus Harrisonbacteria bacterium CG10_big_fil_rev_8_21_14_0_10_45_28]|uniref:Uncharacterized protein n=1 Tax=Candidatus Harrisonbacteria bacterium CG10_big_fil_rev_8_21_14_0_10_45_28 TaxID=1974586 RepID=A0A2H0UNR4_9BACT|nr:MAG: hypothetical protein COU10_01280 [Candidatus Harrisonbacteria bacterium CG10_big_fil_rev_8_21_14_0_10_45_28]
MNGAFAISLRRLSPEVSMLVEADDPAILRPDSDDGIILEEFAGRVQAYLQANPGLDLSTCDIYVGFWGQWSLTIPTSFFALISETGLKVVLDLND